VPPGTSSPIHVGPGFSDVGTHQVVRTSADRVYIFAPELYQNYIHAYRATTAGIPSAFAEADAAHRPVARAAISVVDAAIDGNDRVHLIWMDNDGPMLYGTFDTRTDAWGPSTQLADSRWPSSNGLRQGSEGVALALDGAGTVHVVYTLVENSRRYLYYNNNAGGTWNHQARVDDQNGVNNGHPTMAFDGNGRLYVAWLVEAGANQGSLRIRGRSAGGAWDSASTLIAAGQFANDFYSLDQGPSLLITRDGRLHIAYIGAYEQVGSQFQYGRIHYRHSADGIQWTADDPPTAHYTHNPSLATDAAGTIYLFGHEEAWLRDSCASMYMYKKPAGGNWTPDWSLLADGCLDSSVSVKWSWSFWNNPAVVDLVLWTQQEPNQLYYMAISGS
jgi:hypothetical protein